MTSSLSPGLAQRAQSGAFALLRAARPRPGVLPARLRPSAGSPARALSRSALAVVALSLLAAACSSSGSPSSSSGSTPPATGSAASSAPAAPAAVTIDAHAMSKLGNVLVTSSGMTLYMFVPDNDAKVTCTGLCAATWPPVFIKSGAKPTAGTGVLQAKLGVDTDPAGGDVVTYNGWPLYGYTGDQAPGQATGQGVNVNGGLWYVINTAGQVVKVTP
jgi:predicted lipoprotein with Yx(FWY)xxD motif